MKRAQPIPLPTVTLDRRRPLVPQIAAALRGAIRAGRVAPGARLPPTRTLARACGVSRQIVVCAFEELAASGEIRGRVGAGSYVAANVVTPRLTTKALRDPDGHAIGVTPLYQL